MKIEVATKEYFQEKKSIEENFHFPENIQALIDRAADLYPTTLAINCFEQEPQAQSITYADYVCQYISWLMDFNNKGL